MAIDIVLDYYFDSCIWRDHYENRFGPRGRPLGKYATALFMKIIKKDDVLLYSDVILLELKNDYTDKEIKDALNVLFITGALKRVEIHEEDKVEALIIAKKRNLPSADVLHAILARNNKAILVSQDKHFQQLQD